MVRTNTDLEYIANRDRAPALSRFVALLAAQEVFARAGEVGRDKRINVCDTDGRPLAVHGAKGQIRSRACASDARPFAVSLVPRFKIGAQNLL